MLFQDSPKGPLICVTVRALPGSFISESRSIFSQEEFRKAISDVILGKPLDLRVDVLSEKV